MKDGEQKPDDDDDEMDKGFTLCTASPSRT
jgi:hypothetical protein